MGRDGCCPNVLFDPLPLHRRPLRSPANYIQYFKMRIICMIDRRCKDSLVFLMYFGLKQSQSERKECYARTQSIWWLCNFYMKPFSRQLFRSEKIRTPLRKKLGKRNSTFMARRSLLSNILLVIIVYSMYVQYTNVHTILYHWNW